MARDAVIVAGFGFRAAATVESLRDALAQWSGTPDALATAEDKAAAPAIATLAEEMGVPVIPITRGALGVQPTTTQSEASTAAHGTGSVAEASALAATGPGGVLIAPRCISTDRMATCALAETAPERLL